MSLTVVQELHPIGKNCECVAAVEFGEVNCQIWVGLRFHVRLSIAIGKQRSELFPPLDVGEVKVKVSGWAAFRALHVWIVSVRGST